MIIKKEQKTTDGLRFVSFGVKSECDLYPYEYPDISANENDVVILDRILSSGCIPPDMADDFIIFYINYIAKCK